MTSRPRISKKRKAAFAEAEVPTRPHYFPARAAHHSSNRQQARPIVFLSDGSTLSHNPLSRLPYGQFGFRAPPFTDISESGSTCETVSDLGVTQHVASDFDDSTGSPSELDPNPILFIHSTPPPLSPHRLKRQRQSQRWLNEILPKLVQPYMDIVHHSKNFQIRLPEESLPCTCGKPSRVIAITIVRFANLEQVNLSICGCRLAPAVLLQLGCFPCAPVIPTLAVDIKVLEFVSRLFVRIAPNHTAWCAALEDFMSSQGYHLHGEDPIRRRFSNALHWYNALKDRARLFVDDLLCNTRSNMLRTPDYETSPATTPDITSYLHTHNAPSSEFSSSTPTSPCPVDCDADSTSSHDSSPQSDMPKLERPSDYLRSRCPLCFGGRRRDIGFDAIVCVDACFTQKHNKQQRDQPLQHPHSVFVPEADVLSMEAHVEFVRPSRPRKQGANGEPIPQEVPDGFEGSMKVPTSVLDGCEDSFTAADERRQKASTKFFDCTALMGLLCRHDRVLWLVNMTSAGEKQHYVLSLLAALFQHLPDDFTIGLLYDVACQLHCSFIKFSFLKEHSHRISFAISVFHAFGHRWPCQIIYHPRKREGYGLSDGEGCERFWHSISKLIPFLRVCGYYVRLYTVDVQIQHLDRESLLGLGKWLERKWIACHDRRRSALASLEKSGKEESFLRQQWAAQIKHQTRPLPSQSQNSGKRAVLEVLQLRDAVARLQSALSNLEESLIAPNVAPYVYLEIQAEIPLREQRLKDAKQKLRTKEMALGLSERQEVGRLVNSPFLKARMNALAVKTRLMERLRQRKFERDRLERTFRKQKTTNEHKADRHLEDAVSKRDPSIQRLAKQYNDLVATMASLIRNNRAPRNAVAPASIDLKSLFSLDVDDAIWDDVGLHDEAEGSAPPPWLSDEAVRSGIRALLERDRCEEEILRLRHERDAMQQWFSEEWAVVEKAVANTGNDGVLYQLNLVRQQLLLLQHEWDRHTALLKASSDAPAWGPTREEIAQFREVRRCDAVDIVNPLLDSDSDSDDDNIDPEADSTLIDLLDHMDLVEDEFE
ncbi:hypothetical protein VNI00_016059 [Paramarasmius palmivorus]|uniref:CxC1-like cysteine cluster associated with KDZ transposases domain-containing protein n=1 Tax=Paramarasmius palmivorus TaxID=297713 RepID=A0AAW0BHS9_9AGAR